MDIQIKYKPSYSMAIIKLGSGEEVKAESGVMVSKSANIKIATQKAQKGFLKSLKTSILGGESFWMNTFTAVNGGGEVLLAPTLPGDIVEINLQGTIFVQSTSFLASATMIELDTQFQGLKGFFSGESLFFLKARGNGLLLISSYGGIEEIEVKGDFIVDTGHIIAFQEGLSYKITKLGGWKSFFLGGEGLVACFSGNGRLWIQSRSVSGLGGWLRKKLPPKQS